LKKYYGKYLKAFNRDDDYLYQDQLEIIDSKFRNNLRTWLKRDEQDINDYVPTKSVRLDKQAKALKENPEIRKVRVTDSMVKFYKMDNLRKTKRL
jgi:intergrase/recombinase